MASLMASGVTLRQGGPKLAFCSSLFIDGHRLRALFSNLLARRVCQRCESCQKDEHARLTALTRSSPSRVASLRRPPRPRSRTASRLLPLAVLLGRALTPITLPATYQAGLAPAMPSLVAHLTPHLAALSQPVHPTFFPYSILLPLHAVRCALAWRSAVGASRAGELERGQRADLEGRGGLRGLFGFGVVACESSVPV